MSRQEQRAVFPPGFNTWPDFQKISWYAIDFDDKLSEIQGLNHHIEALKQKEQDALQDAYEFQDKAREWEKNYEEVKNQMDRFSTELPREVMFLRQTVKKAEKEIMLLQGTVAKRDESIQKLRSRLFSAKEEYKTEIKLLDDIIDERNNEVNQLRENERELKATNQALESCWNAEKGRMDEIDIAAEKYDEAGPALERLNKILATYLGDQLRDGLDWSPGHPNNKSNMDRALDALENELRKASLKPTLSVPAIPTAVSKPPRHIDNLGRRNSVNSAASDVNLDATNFLAAGQRRRSDTNNSRNSVPPNTTNDLSVEMAGENLSEDDAELYDKRSFIDSQRPDSANLKGKGFGDLGNHATVLKKGVKDFGKETGIGLKNQSPNSASPPSYNLLGDELARTPTNGRKRPALGLRSSTDRDNADRRNYSMFGNGTAPPEDDSPKPSNEVFTDDRRRQRGSRFPQKLIAAPEPIIEYRDKIVYMDKLVEVPVPMQCTKAHVEDQLILSPMIREIENKVMVPCHRDHLVDHICPTKEVEIIKEVSVPCHLDHVKDTPPVKSHTEEVIKDVIKEVPAQCRREHENLPPATPSLCYVNHGNDHPPLQFEKVMVSGSSDHLEDHLCPPFKDLVKEKKVIVPCSHNDVDDIQTAKPKVITKEIEILVPCSKAHLSDHTYPTNVIEKIVDRPAEVFVDRPIIQEKIVNKYISTTVYGPRNPLWTIFNIYFDLWTIFIAWMNQKSAFTRAILEKLQSHLPGKLQDWCVSDPLAGRTFEIIDAANIYKTEISGRVALLKAIKKPVEDFDARTEAQNLVNEQDAKNEAKNVPSSVQSSSSDKKGNGKATTTSAEPTAAESETRNRKPTTPDPHLIEENCMRSTLQSHGYEAEYVLATQYTIRRPPLLSNLLMAILLTTFFIVFFLAGCIVREYSSLLKLQGIIRPSWFTRPWMEQGGWHSGGGASLRSRFVVDRDWSSLRYLWEAVARFGWLRQVHFWLERTASGGAGYRMPG